MRPLLRVPALPHWAEMPKPCLAIGLIDLSCDGGGWANNPVLAAFVEAVCLLNVPLDQIDAFSIRTTAAPFNIADNKDAGIIRWNSRRLSSS